MEDDARDERDDERTEKLLVLLVADHLAHALLGALDLDAEGGGPHALNLLPAERAVGNLRRADIAQTDVPARN